MGVILTCDADRFHFDDVPLKMASWELSVVLQAQPDQFRAER